MTFLGVSRINVCISPKNSIYLPQFSDDLFLVIDLFRVLVWSFPIGGGKSVADIDTGGGKILTFQLNHNTAIALSVPKGGAKFHCQFRWGDGKICPPWIRHC